MKRILLILAGLVLIYCIESIDVFGFHNYQPTLESAVVDSKYVLTWPRLYYPGYYDVEVFTGPPGPHNAAVKRIMVYHTLNNKITIDQTFPPNTYWRVSAHGLFKPLGASSDPLQLAEILGDNTLAKPEPTSSYPPGFPASNMPVLTWTSVPGAVYYEFELLEAAPENPNGVDPSSYRINSSRAVFTNGFTPDLSQYTSPSVFWRVRALDYDGNPIGVFSDAQEIYINHFIMDPLKPKINVDFIENPPPLYPVYSWIPLTVATHYEVEILDQPPESPNDIAPSKHRIWSNIVTGFDCYDEEPRMTPGVYYWRVRGLDDEGNPVGVYSDIAKYTIQPPQKIYAATFGDSITHGGGAVSYSPANLEYNFQSYLNFPIYNLGKSGDTSATMLERFDHDVLPFRPQYLIILAGSNSLRGGTPARSVISDLIAIREKCIANGIRPIFLTLPPVNPPAIKKVFDEETVPDWQIQFAKVNSFIREQRYYIDDAAYMTNAAGELPADLAVDGLHPDIRGKQLMAQAINASWARVTQ